MSSELSPSDWAHLPMILDTMKTSALRMNTEEDVDWNELETALTGLKNINDKTLDVSFSRFSHRYESEAINRLATLCNVVTGDDEKRAACLCSDEESAMSDEECTLSDGEITLSDERLDEVGADTMADTMFKHRHHPA